MIYLSSRMKIPYPPISRKEFRDRLAQGKVLALFQNRFVLDLTEWIHIHPGGPNTITFWRGKDLTDQLHAFHSPVVREKTVWAYVIAELSDPSQEAPAEKQSTNESISQAYRDLDNQLRSEGFYKPTLWYYAQQLICLTILAALGVYLVFTNTGETWAIVGSAVLLGNQCYKLIIVLVN
jgi:cytochrome b involved in lipid metabolism